MPGIAVGHNLHRNTVEGFRLWRSSMEKFIAGQNIKHYRKLLAITRDDAQRQVILCLLQLEESKLTKTDGLLEKVDEITAPQCMRRE
jgi:hypothetical protein